MRDWPVEAWVLFLTVGVTAVIYAAGKVAVEIIKALHGIEQSMSKATEAANGIVHELMTVAGEAAHAKGMLKGMEQGKSEVTVPVSPQDLILAPREKEEHE